MFRTRFYHVILMPLAPSRRLFVPDSLSILALLFGPLWLIWHGMWRAAFLYMVAASVPFLVERQDWAGSEELAGLLSLAILLVLGLQANRIRVWHLKRKGGQAEGVIAARFERDAALRFADKMEALGGAPMSESS